MPLDAKDRRLDAGAEPAKATPRKVPLAWLLATPAWFSSMRAGNLREKDRLRVEILQIKGAINLLMKQRNGGSWTAQDKRDIKDLLRRLSSVSPYLLIWLLPGSVILLPFLAWHLDARRAQRERQRPAA